MFQGFEGLLGLRRWTDHRSRKGNDFLSFFSEREDEMRGVGVGLIIFLLKRRLGDGPREAGDLSRPKECLSHSSLLPTRLEEGEKRCNAALRRGGKCGECGSRKDGERSTIFAQKGEEANKVRPLEFGFLKINRLFL